MSIALRSGIARQINSKLFWTQQPPANHIRKKCTVTERIAVTDDGSTIVCWHPEKPFPYECSKPIPEETNNEVNSVLKVQNISAIYDVFKPKDEERTREELMKLTYTSKHVWFPQGKKTYKKKPVPRDREYL